jgi:hypothetical protein
MSQQRTTFTARRPVDLVAVVPQVLGFHPEDSVVLLTFGPGESFHARVDLPADAHDQLGVADMLVGVVTRHGIRRVAVLLYTADPWIAASFHDAVLPRLVRRDVEVIDVLRVDRGRFHSACDPDDTGSPYDLKDHLFTAQQVLDGRVVHESRAGLAASLVLVDAADARAVADEVRRVEGEPGAVRPSQDAPVERQKHARWVQRTIRRAVRTATPLPVADAARLLVLVADVDFRDVAWAEMQRRTAARHVDLWRDLVRRSPGSHRAVAASLLAFAAWLHGDGALAWCALDRCHEVDPDSTMAACVARLLEGAVPPSTWTPIPEEDLPVLGSGPAGPPSLPPVS